MNIIELAKRRRRRLEKDVLDEADFVIAGYRHHGNPDLEALAKAVDRLHAHLEVSR
jgi:hypothetical protein